MKERIIASRTLLRPWIVGAGAALLVTAFAGNAICSQSLLPEHGAAMDQNKTAANWHVILPNYARDAHRGDDFLDLLDATDPVEVW
jgi:hypothetical protein